MKWNKLLCISLLIYHGFYYASSNAKPQDNQVKKEFESIVRHLAGENSRLANQVERLQQENEGLKKIIELWIQDHRFAVNQKNVYQRQVVQLKQEHTVATAQWIIMKEELLKDIAQLRLNLLRVQRLSRQSKESK